MPCLSRLPVSTRLYPSRRLAIYSKTSITRFILTLTLSTQKFKVTDHQKLNLHLNLNLNVNLNLNLNLNQSLNWGSAQYSTSEKFNVFKDRYGHKGTNHLNTEYYKHRDFIRGLL